MRSASFLHVCVFGTYLLVTDVPHIVLLCGLPASYAALGAVDLGPLCGTNPAAYETRFWLQSAPYGHVLGWLLYVYILAYICAARCFVMCVCAFGSCLPVVDVRNAVFFLFGSPASYPAVEEVHLGPTCGANLAAYKPGWPTLFSIQQDRQATCLSGTYTLLRRAFMTNKEKNAVTCLAVVF